MLQATADKEMESDNITFTNDELVRALIDAQNLEEDDADIMTSADLADALGLSVKTVQKRVKRLVKAGVIVPCKKRIVDIVGRNTTTFGYRLK